MSLVVKLRDGETIFIEDAEDLPAHIEPLYVEENLIDWVKTGDGRTVHLFIKNAESIDQEVSFRED